MNLSRKLVGWRCCATLILGLDKNASRLDGVFECTNERNRFGLASVLAKLLHDQVKEVARLWNVEPERGQTVNQARDAHRNEYCTDPFGKRRMSD